VPSSLLNIMIDLWPIISAITPILFGAGFLYLRTQFPTKADFDSLARTVGDLANRLTATTTAVDHLAQEQDSAPTRIQLMEKIAAVDARVSGVERGLGSIERQLNSTNDYLKILVDRGLDR